MKTVESARTYIEAGADPVALVDPPNRAQREAETARAVLDALPPTRNLDRAGWRR